MIQGDWSKEALDVSPNERTPMRACVAIGGTPLVHPPGHPRAGEVVEFPITVPGCYSLEFSAGPYFMRYDVDIDEDGRARLRLVEKSDADGSSLSPAVCAFLDSFAELLVLDLLAHPPGVKGPAA